MFTAKAGDDSVHSEYQQYVHTYINSSEGNWTSVDKPMFPVYFNDSQIAIGGTWSIVEPLVANHSYHVYCYGKWVNNGSAPKTDYDIYVFNPQGVQESEHTEAAGLPEHLGTRVNDTFFVPSVSGDYTFVIANDARQSNDTEQATFAGSYAVYPCESTMLTAKVEEQPFYVKNGTLIGGGFFGLIIVSGAVFYIRKRLQ